MDLEGSNRESNEGATPSETGSYPVKQTATVNFQIWKMPQALNIVGPRIKTLRREKELTQSALAARCGLLGWDTSENVITKIETQIRCVTDYELLCLSRALRVAPEVLLPPPAKAQSVIKEFFAENPPD